MSVAVHVSQSRQAPTRWGDTEATRADISVSYAPGRAGEALLLLEAMANAARADIIAAAGESDAPALRRAGVLT